MAVHRLLVLPVVFLGVGGFDEVCMNQDSDTAVHTVIDNDAKLNDMHLLQMIARQSGVAEFTVAKDEKDFGLEQLEKLMDDPKELEKAFSDPEQITTLTNDMVKDAPARLTFMLDSANETQGSLSGMYRHGRHGRFMCTELDEEDFPPLPLRRRNDRRACARAGLHDLSDFRQVVNMEVENEFLPVFASLPLNRKNEKIDRVVIVHHGVRANANRYFCDMVRGSPSNTLVIAPWLSHTRVSARTWAGSKTNSSDAKSVCWNSRFFEWMNGGNTAHSETTSFAVMDTLVKTLQKSHANFPNLKRIFVSGFSAGCQMVSRWAVYTPATVQNSKLTPVTTVVGGCGTYLYFDKLRPALSCSPLANSGEDHQCSDFLEPKNCPTYNTYRYGLKKGIDSHHHHSFDHNKYLTSFGAYSETMKHVQASFIQKDVRFIFGRHDVCNCKMEGYKNDEDVCYRRDGGCKGHALGVYCEELLEGTNRLQRGLNYVNSLRHFYASRNQTYEPRFSFYEGGHSDSRFYKSDAFQAWVFGPNSAL